MSQTLMMKTCRDHNSTKDLGTWKKQKEGRRRRRKREILASTRIAPTRTATKPHANLLQPVLVKHGRAPRVGRKRFFLSVVQGRVLRQIIGNQDERTPRRIDVIWHVFLLWTSKQLSVIKGLCRSHSRITQRPRMKAGQQQRQQQSKQQGVFPQTRCALFFCDRWSMTLTGDTMSSVARDAAAGAARRRRERRYRSFWLMAVKMATLTACHHSAQKKPAATHAATQTDVTHGEVTSATGLVNPLFSIAAVETPLQKDFAAPMYNQSQSGTDPYSLLQSSSVRVRGTCTCD